MDLDEIRRKRVRLFGPHADAPPPALPPHLPRHAAGESSAMPDLNQFDMNPDEVLARALQAQFDEGYNASASLPPPPQNGLPSFAAFGTPPPAKLSLGATVIPTGVATSPYHAPHMPDFFPKLWKPKKKAKATIEVKTTPIVAHDIDRSADAVSVRIFTSNAVFFPCASCQKPRSTGQISIVQMFAAGLFHESQGHIANEVECNLFCDSCLTKTCSGCGELLSYWSEKFGTQSNGIEFKWHCDRGRLALIWFLLAGYDNRVKHNKPHTIVRENSAGPDRGRGSKNVFTGAGYSKRGYSVVSGVGYGGDDDYDYDSDVMHSPVDEHHESAEDPDDGEDYDSEYDDINSYPQLRSGAAKRYKRSTSPIRFDPDDRLTTRIMEALSVLLPSPKEQLVPTLFDHSPPTFLLCMLMRCSILDRAAELLRNDSLEDATRREDLYNSLLNFLRTLTSNSSEMAKAVHEKRAVNKAGHDLLKVSFNEPTRLNEEPVATAPALASCMVNLTSQSIKMLKSGEANAAVFETEDAQQMLLLCRNILEVSDLVHATAIIETTAEGITSTADDSSGWAKELAVADVPDDVILNSHYFKSEVDKMGKPPVGRMRHIIKEITALNTSLPPGIFVRHGESRLDVMKVVITGPKGTPYENGLFEFDLLCPSEYPGVPPAMQLKTTGGGAVGFNPNLYASGKVCLSLLGTWQGETWQPGKSTLLQVLVSVQAMIFCEEPWCNEPGRESMHGTEDSMQYNRSLFPSVVKYSMLEWLENKRSIVMPPKARKAGPRSLGDGIDDIAPRVDAAFKANEVWDEVTKKHFQLNKDDIIKTVDAWVKDKPKESAMRKAYDFIGTGWGGRTLGGDGSADDAAGPALSAREDELISKLKGVMGQLEINSKSRHGLYGFAPEEFE